MQKNNMTDWVEALFSKIRTLYKRIKITHLEKKYNWEVDFWKEVDSSGLSFDETKGNDYSPSPSFPNVLCKNKKICADDNIMDLGCGKGYALFLFERFGFGSLYGVELDARLALTASDNIRTIYGEYDNKISIYNIDATQLMDNSETRSAVNKCNYFYIYNSFPPDVALQVISELELSIYELPRKVVVWYASPSDGCIEGLNNSDVFMLNRQYKFFMYPATSVYEFCSKMK